jgi:hypothetical protein
MTFFTALNMIFMTYIPLEKEDMCLVIRQDCCLIFKVIVLV